MRINGATDHLGDWNKGSGPVKMQVGMPRQWLTGGEVQPWELEEVVFKINEIANNRLVYKYTSMNENTKEAIWEREPSRMLNIMDPKDYVAFKIDRIMTLGASTFKKAFIKPSIEWRNVSDVYIVNGHVEKADANFVDCLSYDVIGNENIVLGPYPMSTRDIDVMHEQGITGVLNV